MVSDIKIVVGQPLITRTLKEIDPQIILPYSLKKIKKEAWPTIISKSEEIRKKVLKLINEICKIEEVPVVDPDRGIVVDKKTIPSLNIDINNEIQKKALEIPIRILYSIFDKPMFAEEGYDPKNILMMEMYLPVVEYSILRNIPKENSLLKRLFEGFVEELAEIQKELIDLRLFVFKNLK